MVARGLVAISLALLSVTAMGCGKSKPAGAGADAGADAGKATAQVKAKGKEKEKEKEKDPNAPPRPPVKHPDFPNTPEGIKALAATFIAPGADQPSLARGLRPDLEDYDEVFRPDAAAKLRHELEEVWDEPGRKVNIPEGRTEIKVWTATVDELLAGKGKDQACIDSYKGVAKMLKPGVVVNCFKFQKPGEMMGSAYDGLIYVRGHWAVFPRPEKILQHVEEEEAEEAAAKEKAAKEAKDKAPPK